MATTQATGHNDLTLDDWLLGWQVSWLVETWPVVLDGSKLISECYRLRVTNAIILEH